MAARVGAVAPAFSLMDQDRNVVGLDDFEGRKAVIVFIPWPFTGICDGETCAIRDSLTSLNDLNADVVVITCHSVAVTKKWSDENGFAFPILSDFWPHGTVASDFGAFNREVGVANRMSFVLDSEGIVRSIISSGSLGAAREFAEYTDALAEID